MATPDGDPRVAALLHRVEQVIQGKRAVVEMSLVAVLAGGHILLEDVPGVGKTTLAHALAGALGGSFSRVQFTADLLPSDVLGVAILDPGRTDFRFRPGPVFANVVLADEINRAPPRTQSALLEAMNAGRVSVDGVTRTLPAPFVVVATQNPHDHVGTFPLPDSQLDRFLLRLSMGYPDREAERVEQRCQAGLDRLCVGTGELCGRFRPAGEQRHDAAFVGPQSVQDRSRRLAAREGGR